MLVDLLFQGLVNLLVAAGSLFGAIPALPVISAVPSYLVQVLDLFDGYIGGSAFSDFIFWIWLTLIPALLLVKLVIFLLRTVRVLAP